VTSNGTIYAVGWTFIKDGRQKQIFVAMTQPSPVGQGLTIIEALDRSQTQHTRLDPIEPVISPTQTTLPDNTQELQRDGHQCPVGIQTRNPW
jgi:hypothetical protein